MFLFLIIRLCLPIYTCPSICFRKKLVSAGFFGMTTKNSGGFISCFSIFFLSLSLSPPVPATFLLNIITCAHITFHQNSFHRFCHNIFCLTVYCLFLSFHQIIRLLSQLFFGASDTYLRQFDSFQDASDLARWSFNSTFPQSFWYWVSSFYNQYLFLLLLRDNIK